MSAHKGPYTGDYSDAILKDRVPGTPIKDVEVHDVSDHFGDGTLLLASGKPDFVLTPPGFGDVIQVAKLGITERERCDVLSIVKGGPKGAPACTSCHRTDGYAHTWKVVHRRTGVQFILLDCSCKSVSWTGPVAGRGSEADRG